MNLGLVNCPVSKSTLVGRFVDDHSVVHVVSRVGDNSHNRICPIWVVIQAICVVKRGPDYRGLPCLQPINLVVCAIVERSPWCTHGLLAHLTLVHVTRRLVIVGEGCHVGDNRQYVCWSEFDVSGQVRDKILFQTRNLHERLLEWTDVVQLLEGKILNRSEHSGCL